MPNIPDIKQEDFSVYTNGINSYNTVKDGTSGQRTSSQNFDFDGEAFSDLMDKENPSGNGLRESAKELAEDESILSTDEENRAMIKKKTPEKEQTQKPAFPEDKARLLRLMDISNKIKGINISKSKRELENTVGTSFENDTEPEDITSVIAKMYAGKEKTKSCDDNDIETSIDMDNGSDDFDDDEEGGKDSQILYETEEELIEDMSVLSTEEENLEMARRNSSMRSLSDDDYKTSQEDMIFLDEITALNNQANIEQPNAAANIQNVLSALMNQTKMQDYVNRIDISELSEADVDYIIDILKSGTADASNYFEENGGETSQLSGKFFALLKDAVINKKVFRIDFDNDISVIIKISTEGKISAEFQTSDEAAADYLKNNLHVLKQRFEELNIEYDDIAYKTEQNAS